MEVSFRNIVFMCLLITCNYVVAQDKSDKPANAQGVAAQKNQNNPAQAVVEKKSGDIVQSQGSNVASSAKKNDVPATNCNDKSQISTVTIPIKNYLLLVDNSKAVAMITDLSNCYIKAKTTKLLTFKHDGPWIFERRLRGEVLIEDAKQIDVDEAYKLTNAGENERKLFASRIAKRDYESKKVWLLNLKLMNVLSKDVVGGTPKTHPMAKKVATKSDVKSAIRKGSFIYDVRPAGEYSKDSIKGAVNLNFTEYKKAATAVYSPTDLEKMGIFVKKSLLPKNKQDAIYVFSNCPADFLSYNAVTMLGYMGYSNVFWYRQGFVNFKDKAKCGTPKEETEGIISSNEVIDALKDKKTVFLDFRDVVANSEIAIKGAIKSKFRQRMTTSGIAKFRNNIDAKVLKRKKEMVSGSSVGKTDTPIIVYGQDEFDWAPYKAMLYFKANGYKNVRWYRAGFNDWVNKYIADPKKYEINKTVPRDKLIF